MKKCDMLQGSTVTILAALVVCAGVCCPFVVEAATITWSVRDITGNVSDVSTNGTPVVAHSGADLGTANVVDGTTFTINGVTFDDGFVIDSPSNLDTIDGRAGVGITGDYYTLLRYVDRLGTGNAVVTFSNLTAGITYQIQVWYSDNAGVIVKDVGVVLNDGGIVNTPTHGAPGHATLRAEIVEAGPGQFATGFFVADSTTQQFMARSVSGLTSTPVFGSGATLSAVQLRNLGTDTTPPSPAPTVAVLTPFETRVEVTASTNTTDQTGVEYQFARRLGLGGPVTFTSAWQDSHVFMDTGLVFNTQYSYTVTARDKVPPGYGGPFMTSESAEVATTTLTQDTTPPTPATMTFSAPPSTVDLRTITMTAVEASDTLGVQYQFVRRRGVGGTIELTSGWQDSPVFTDTGLDAGTTYSYTVQARDKADAGNVNGVSSERAATTDPKGTAIITWVVSNITGSVNDISTNGVLIQARNGNPTSAVTVNGVLFDMSYNVGDLMANVTNNDNISSRAEGSVTPFDINYRSMLRLAQRANGNNPPSEPWTTIELLGLDRSSTYEFQIWVADNAATAGDVGLVVGNGAGGDPVRTPASTILQEAVEGGSGQFAIGTFVANSRNQSINVRKYTGLLSTPAGQSSHFCNGWQLRLTYTPPSGTVLIIK